MKTNFTLIGVLVLMAISTISCNLDDGTQQYAYIPTSQEFESLLSESLDNHTQTATFDAGTTFTFTSEKGVKLTINGNCLKNNGVAVTGNVDLEFIELFDRGSMLVTNKPTMGVQDGENRLLTSGGEFYVNATQNGEQLTLDCYMTLTVPTSLTGGTDNDMLPFNGSINADGELIWEQSTSTDFWIGTSQAVGSVAYNALYNNFGWFNCDRFINYTGPKTTITALVPQGYGNGNSFIFQASPDFPNSLGKVYGEFPVGLESYFIFVTEENGLFRYAIKPSEPLEAGHTVTFTLAETTLGTEAELTGVINALP